jgi:hypothetical protein
MKDFCLFETQDYSSASQILRGLQAFQQTDVSMGSGCINWLLLSTALQVI